MQILSRDQHTVSLSPAHPAAFQVELGEVFRVECPSAFGGVFDENGQSDSPSEQANPAAGPVAVASVQHGDTIAVRIRSITPVGYGKASGVMYAPRDGILHYLDGLTAPIDPSIGVIGVAPRLEKDATLNSTCGAHGGNLDCRDVASGATVFFRARVDGAMLSFGDVHLAMGDGELGGQGIESAADITLSVSKAAGAGVEWPWIIRNGVIMTLGGHPDFLTAQRIAYEEMMTLCRNLLDLERSEVQARIAVAGSIKICQSCCSVITVRVCLPLESLGVDPDAFPTELIRE